VIPIAFTIQYPGARTFNCFDNSTANTSCRSPIFLDIRTSSDINSINTLIQSYARIHSPAYGQPIAGSGLSSLKLDQERYNARQEMKYIE
jgi:hypothetical protein